MKTSSILKTASDRRPEVIADFSAKTIPYTSTIIEAALSLSAGMQQQGVFITGEADALGDLLPASIEPSTPLHVIAVNDMPKLALNALATKAPYCMNVNSTDLLRNKTFIWFGNEGEPCAGVSVVLDWKRGPVLRLFLTPTRALLVYDEIGDELFNNFTAAASCAGDNYNPHNVWTETELSEAKQTVELRGVSGNAFQFEARQISLVACALEETRLTGSKSIPEDFPAERYLFEVDSCMLKATILYRHEDGTYALDFRTPRVFARLATCLQVARAIAVKCLREVLTIHQKHSKQEILERYYKKALSMESVTRAEACWAICWAAEQMRWDLPQVIADELRTYRD